MAPARRKAREAGNGKDPRRRWRSTAKEPEAALGFCSLVRRRGEALLSIQIEACALDWPGTESRVELGGGGGSRVGSLEIRVVQNGLGIDYIYIKRIFG